MNIPKTPISNNSILSNIKFTNLLLSFPFKYINVTHVLGYNLHDVSIETIPNNVHPPTKVDLGLNIHMYVHKNNINIDKHTPVPRRYNQVDVIKDKDEARETRVHKEDQ